MIARLRSAEKSGSNRVGRTLLKFFFCCFFIDPCGRATHTYYVAHFFVVETRLFASFKKKCIFSRLVFFDAYSVDQIRTRQLCKLPN